MIETILTMLVIAASAITALFTAVATGVICMASEKTGKKKASTVFPKVTILKPVKNTDSGFEQNIRSFYEQDYPLFELVFGVDNENDHCVSILKQISQDYPQIITRIVVTGEEKTGNPKIDTLSACNSAITGNYVWITDSNVRVTKNTLSQLIQETVETDAKIVFSPIIGAGHKTLASIVENAYINLFVSGATLMAWSAFKKPVITGKSMLIEMKTLNERYGGFASFSNYLAEDYLLGDTFHKDGYRVSTNYVWVTNINETSSFKQIYNRIERWAILRNRLNPFYMLEILANPLVWIIALLASGQYGFGIALALITVLHEYTVLFCINSNDRTSGKVILLYPLACAIKGLLMLLIYVRAFFIGNVLWRGRHIRIGKKTVINEGA